jgi:hypothetical protein
MKLIRVKKIKVNKAKTEKSKVMRNMRRDRKDFDE